MTTRINIAVNSEELLFNSKNSINQNRLNFVEQNSSRKTESRALTAWNDKISKQGFDPKNKQIYGAKQVYAKESLAESQRVKNPVASYKRRSIPFIPFQIDVGADGPYIGSTLTLSGIPCGSFEVDWKVDGVIDESQHNNIDFYVENSHAGHDIEAVITCSDGEVYTTDPVNAGTAVLPLSYTGNVEMKLLVTHVGCADQACIQIESVQDLGIFTADDHRTFYIIGNLYNSGCIPPVDGFFGDPRCPESDECGGGVYRSCPADIYSIDLFWRLGRIGLIGVNSFPTVSTGGGAIPYRLLAIPV